MRLVIFSDTHNQHASVPIPDGDVLVFCGDACAYGTAQDFMAFAEWFGSYPHALKLYVAGNHDLIVESSRDACAGILHAKANAVYLEDSGIVLPNGMNCWGSPWTPRSLNWAFQQDPGPELRAIWQKVPNNTNVLITHGPSYGLLDLYNSTENIGDPQLRNRIEELRELKVHAHGHVHEGYGTALHTNVAGAQVLCVNAALVDQRVRLDPTRSPVVLDLV